MKIIAKENAKIKESTDYLDNKDTLIIFDNGEDQMKKISELYEYTQIDMVSNADTPYFYIFTNKSCAFWYTLPSKLLINFKNLMNMKRLYIIPVNEYECMAAGFMEKNEEAFNKAFVDIEKDYNNKRNINICIRYIDTDNRLCIKE